MPAQFPHSSAEPLLRERLQLRGIVGAQQAAPGERRRRPARRGGRGSRPGRRPPPRRRTARRPRPAALRARARSARRRITTLPSSSAWMSWSSVSGRRSRVTRSGRCVPLVGGSSPLARAGPAVAAPRSGRSSPGPWAVPISASSCPPRSSTSPSRATAGGHDPQRGPPQAGLLVRRRRRARPAWCARHAGGRRQLADRRVQVGGEVVDVGHRLVVAEQAEEDAPVVGHDRDPERRVEHERHLGVERAQAPAEHEDRELRAGDVGDGDVEEPLQRLQPCALVEQRGRREAGHLGQRLGADRLAEPLRSPSASWTTR